MIDDIKRYLSYFPRMVVPAGNARRQSHRPTPTAELFDIVSRDNKRVYDMRNVLDVIFDRPTGSRCNRSSGGPSSSPLAHLGGHPVAMGRISRR